MSTLNLDHLLSPRSIALVGASDRPGSAGQVVAGNLVSGGYQGRLYFINPRYRSVLDQPCLRSLKLLDETPDLVVFIAPGRIIRRTLVQCQRKGVKVVLIMSAVSDPAALQALAASLGIRVLGPYCAGLIRPQLNLNISYATYRIQPGPLAIVTQSASLAAAILDWAEPFRVGFSALLAVGDCTDVSLADLLDLLSEDVATRAIIVYVDRLPPAREFLSAISAAARGKPLLLMKSTHSAAPWCDAILRTGQVHTSGPVFDAAMARAGVVRIKSFSNLFAAARILALDVRVRGPRLAILSNGAAPAMLACERIETKGFTLPPLPEFDSDRLKQTAGPFTGCNPVVLRGRRQLARRYQDLIRLLADSGAFDAIIVIHVPDSRNDPQAVAAAVVGSLPSRVPLLTCWMGESRVREARATLSAAQLATFRTPEAATDGFDFLYRHFRSQQQLLQLPGPVASQSRSRPVAARWLIAEQLDLGRRVLPAMLAMQVLACFDIPAAGGPAAAADRPGRPPSDAGGEVPGRPLHPAASNPVVGGSGRRPPLNERLVTLSLFRDASFGPVIALGLYGDQVMEIPACVQLPPLNDYLIDRLLGEPPMARWLGPLRERPALRTDALIHALQQVSEIACELPEVFSLTIGRLRVRDDHVIPETVQLVIEKAPRLPVHGHLAIHPYPRDWIRRITLKDGRSLLLRPIRPEDAMSVQALVRGMSSQSRYFRFMHAINELSPLLVARFTRLDYDRQMSFVAVADEASSELIGVSRYSMNSDRTVGEFALSIADHWQSHGLGKALMNVLIEHARSRGLQRLLGTVLRDNEAMIHLMQALEFTGSVSADDPGTLDFTLELDSGADSPDDA